MTARSPGTTTDAGLIAASGHDAELFGVLYDRHAPALYRFAAQRLGTAVADDLVSETFLHAFRRRARYDVTRPDARPWLFGILVREIAQRRRQESTRYRLLARLPAPDPVDDHADRIAGDVGAEAARQSLMRELAGLRPGDRDVLLLFAWADLTYPQIAAALDIPVGTVRSRLNRARRRLRDPLEHLDPRRIEGDLP